VLQLRTLGMLELRTPSGASVAMLLAQPRSTALLIHLLLARPRGYLSRDILCDLFWPDADEEHAHGALSQALTRIRRAAGADVFEVRGKNEIRVAGGAVDCDVLIFERALSAGDHAAALDLYRGPFLRGFHAGGAAGFERWAESERDRLRTLAAAAARALAVERIADGRLADARHAAARALELAPESEATAGELVRALAAAGDRVGAVSLYDAWASALYRDLELEPSAALLALAGELRRVSAAGAEARGRSEANAVVATHVEAEARGQTEANADVAAFVEGAARPAADCPEQPTEERREAAPVEPPGTPPAVDDAPRRPRRRGVAAGAAVVFALLLGGWAVVQTVFLSAGLPVEASGRAAGMLTKHDWMLVADFDASSVDPGLALAFQTLLIRDIESAGYATVVGGIGALSRRSLDDVLARMRLPLDTPIGGSLACEIAEREGAAGVLIGRVLPLGNDFVLTASILEAKSCREVVRASTVAGFDQLSEAVAAVSRELRARLGESRAHIRSSPPLPPVTTGYIAALHAVSRYISDAGLWDDEDRGAAELMEAVRIEPGFAFAHFLLALHYQRLGRFALAMPHVLLAHQHRGQLPRQGRLGMEAIHDRYIASDLPASMATVETIIAEFPAITDATMPFLADAALWAGDWQRALDVARDYLDTAPVGLGARLAGTTATSAARALGLVELADSLHRMIPRVAGQEGAHDRSAVLMHHVYHGDWSGAQAYCASYPAWDRCGYLLLARGRLSAAAAVLAQVARERTTRRQPWDRPAAVAALAHIELLQGRRDKAWTLLQDADWSLPMTDVRRPATHLERFVLCAAAAGLRRSQELAACAIEGEDPADWDADPSFTVVLRSGAWSRRLLALRSLERGEAGAAIEHVRGAVRSNFGNAAMLDHLIQGLAFDAMNAADSALTHFMAAARIERDCCFPTAAGIIFPLAPLYRRIGELSEARGDTATALHYYGATVALWAEADPVLQPQVRAARQRMALLQSDPGRD
jgi:DNA-binding SARP family transcriptional activator/tetratricopeptide (TPR) repeat protein